MILSEIICELILLTILHTSIDIVENIAFSILLLYFNYYNNIYLCHTILFLLTFESITDKIVSTQ